MEVGQRKVVGGGGGRGNRSKGGRDRHNNSKYHSTLISDNQSHFLHDWASSNPCTTNFPPTLILPEEVVYSGRTLSPMHALGWSPPPRVPSHSAYLAHTTLITSGTVTTLTGNVTSPCSCRALVIPHHKRLGVGVGKENTMRERKERGRQREREGGGGEGREREREREREGKRKG